MQTLYNFNWVPAAVLLAALTACDRPTSNESKNEQPPMDMYADDPHSYANPNEVAITHLSLDLRVDFDDRQLVGSATYKVERNKGDTLKLDISGMDIHSVTDARSGEQLPFDLVPGNELGQGLYIALQPQTEQLTVSYRTVPDAAALMWLAPEQTLGKKHPFLFSQGQAILTRSWIPIQDSPALRITYEADIRVPKGLMALMSAENPTAVDTSGHYSFKMSKAIPPYLIALAVGELAFERLGEQSGVYAEPELLDEAAYEFAEVEQMIDAAEKLYGPYRWGRYDILVLPPSFPFGGMENPMLTFATPTIIAGDRSLTSLVAHELAHSWSGNLVTNASWNDFWLNEGFTVYFEKRIMEALYGADYADMLNVLGRQDLQHTIERLGADNPDTRLKLDLEGRDPDEGMTDIAYEKGYLFLKWLEQQVGRDKFDAFLKNYFDVHAFQTMTTEDFVAYLDSTLLQGMELDSEVNKWIYQPGIPAGAPQVYSARFERVDSLRASFVAGELRAAELPAAEWSTHEWMHFLRGLPQQVEAQQLQALDTAWALTGTGNSEVAAEWYTIAISNNYQKAFPALKEFLMRVGRRKFLEPLYRELAKDPAHKAWAISVYEQAREGYHSVSYRTIDAILGTNHS